MTYTLSAPADASTRISFNAMRQYLKTTFSFCGFSKLLAAGFCTIFFSNFIGWQPGHAQALNAPSGSAELRPEVTVAIPAESRKQRQWEKRSGSLIKWKVHPVTTIDGGLAKLTTTFDRKGGSYGTGAVKYQLALWQIPELPDTMAVQLLDKNGFKLMEFQLFKENFHPVPGTNVIEAAEDWTCSGRDYRRARDYVVK